MVGEQIKRFRKLKGYTLHELGKKVGKSDSTISRLETQKAALADLELLKKIADVLGVRLSDLIEPKVICYDENLDINNFESGELFEVLKEDDEQHPSIPEDAILKIRVLNPNEKLQVGSFYWIEFKNQRKFRIVVEDEENGLGFLPHNITEQRISYDREYVKILGKVVSMTVIFEDIINYE